jgi:hypothetical protein
VQITVLQILKGSIEKQTFTAMRRWLLLLQLPLGGMQHRRGMVQEFRGRKHQKRASKVVAFV